MIVLDQVTSVLSSGRLRKTVLEAASLTLPTDQHLAILGHEGTGKSTLIRLLAGSLMPNAGSIRRHARVSFPVGFSAGYKRNMSAYENVAYVARLYGADVREVTEFVAQVTGIGDALEEDLGDLPPHLRIRLAYTVSYAIPFDVYLIDNRIFMGDREFRRRCQGVFEARMQHSGFILTTSLPRYAQRLANRAAVLHDGRLALYDDFDRAIWDFERLERRPLSPGAGMAAGEERVDAAA